MAVFTVVTTPAEQDQVVEALKKLQGETVPVTKVASVAGMNPNRVRYILVDLEELGRIKRIPVKAFNKHYIRYQYEVV